MDNIKRRLRNHNSDEKSDESSSDELIKEVAYGDNMTSFPSPVYIDLVLLGIFSYLELPDLKNCREVCKLWNKIGMQVLQSNNNTKIVFKPVPKIRGQRNQNPFHPIKEFAKSMSLSTCNPFCNYEFQNLSLRNPAVKSFFQQCGSNIKSLSALKNAGYSNRQYLDLRTFAKILIELTPNLEVFAFEELPRVILESDGLVFTDGCAGRKFSLPKLQTLVFPNIPLHPRFTKYPYKLGGIWIPILNAAPNLNEIVSNIEYSCNMISMLYQEQFLKALTDTNRLGGLTKLRLIHIDGSNLVQLTSGASKLGMSLIEFHVDAVNENPYPRSMQRFLQTQRKSLKILTIGSFEEGAFLLRINFPEMESLTTLSLAVFPGPSAKAIENTVLTAAFPKLVSLHIHAVRLGDLLNFSTTSTHPGVKNLNLRLWTSESSDIPRIASIFPNIETAKLTTPEPDIKILACSIWITWPNLTELDLCQKGGLCFRASRNNE